MTRLSGCSCGARVRYVILGARTVAVDPEPHSAGLIAVPVDGYKNLAYRLERSEPPARGYRRHRPHTHRADTRGDAA